MKDGGPVFPRTAFLKEGWPEHRNSAYSGMTLRDYFAAHEQYDNDDHEAFGIAEKEKMMGCKYPADSLGQAQWWWAFKAKIRLMKADAMIAERDK